MASAFGLASRRRLWTTSFLWPASSITYKGQTFAASVRLRGGIRFCNSFPLLKLKLPKTHPIDGQREFKILTHGIHELDSSIAVHAPACGDTLSANDQREINRLENRTYELSRKLLDYHLQTSKFDVHYVDPANGLDFTERAYFLEDKDSTAKRFQMKTYTVSGLNGFMPWRGQRDEEEFQAKVFEDEIRNYLSQQYLSIQTAQADWTKLEVSKELLRSNSDLQSSDKWQELISRAEARKEVVRQSIKGEQWAILQKFDQTSLAQTFLFNALIQNTDWGVFGLDPGTSSSIKNVGLLQNQAGIVFTVPYDFNESGWISSPNQIAGVAVYKTALLAFAQDMRMNMDAYLLSALRQQIPVFIERLKQLQSADEYDAKEKTRFANFAQALTEFAETL